MRRLIDALALAWPLARRDIAARYRGSLGGVFWALVGPLAMVVIYAAVFQGVFRARWPGSGAEGAPAGLDFALRLFAGLIVFSAFAEVATRATRIMSDHANLVKRVVFPLELLCVALVMQVAVHASVQLLLLAVLVVVWGGGVGPSVAWMLLVVPWVLTVLLAVALTLAALGTYLRDLQHLVPLATTGLMFLSPVFYPQAAAPQALQAVLALNPLTAPIEAMRAAWFDQPLQTGFVLPQVLAALVALALALALFRRLRPGFADLV